jgi:hypothetical protein
MNAHDLTVKVWKEASELGYRLFRNNIGKTWIGQSEYFNYRQNIAVEPGDVVIRKARRFNAGLYVGSGDLIGWNKQGKFTSFEIKANNDTVKPEQKNWHDNVINAGGESRIIRSLSDLK